MGMPSSALLRRRGRLPEAGRRGRAAEQTPGRDLADLETVSAAKPGPLDPAPLERAYRSLAPALRRARAAGSGARRSFRRRWRWTFLRYGAHVHQGPWPLEMVSSPRRMARGRHLRPGRRWLPALLRSMRSGWCRTSRRCSTTTRCSRGCTCLAGDGRRRLRRVSRRPSSGSSREMTSPRAASTRHTTPTARARRASSSSGAGTRC